MEIGEEMILGRRERILVFPVYKTFILHLQGLLSESGVAQSCPTLCDPMDNSLPGSFVHGIFQARILEWVATSFSKRSSQPRDWTWVFCIVGRYFTVWATREVAKTDGKCTELLWRTRRQGSVGNCNHWNMRRKTPEEEENTRKGES